MRHPAVADPEALLAELLADRVEFILDLQGVQLQADVAQILFGLGEQRASGCKCNVGARGGLQQSLWLGLVLAALVRLRRRRSH